MELYKLYLPSPVQIGLIKMKSKIIHYIVCREFFVNKEKKFRLVWTHDRSKLTILAFSSISHFQVRLPTGKLHLIVQIRVDCLTKYNLSSITFRRYCSVKEYSEIFEWKSKHNWTNHHFNFTRIESNE